MKTLEIKVTNCSDCPFSVAVDLEGAEHYCIADKETRIVQRSLCLPSDIKLEDKKEWCPLNNNTISIKLNK